MFGIRTFITIFVLVVVLLAGIVLERYLARLQSPRPGLILPVLTGIVAVVLSVQNFLIAFRITFSMSAFAAAVSIFVFYMIPPIVFFLLYVDERRDMEEKRQDRARRNRAARRQQTIQQDLKGRYRPPVK